jgi:hypothetical protein
MIPPPNEIERLKALPKFAGLDRSEPIKPAQKRSKRLES